MHTIQIEDDVYEFLLRNTKRFGESETDVMRRLFNLGTSRQPQSQATTKSAQATQGGTKNGNGNDPVAAFLNSPAFLVHGNVVGKFLSVLSWLHKQNPSAFDKVLLVNGRRRHYFGKSANEIEQFGNSPMPKAIPETPYYVFTNSPTQLKRHVVGDVMRILGYDSSATRSVVDALK